MFTRGDFVLRKWNSSNHKVLTESPPKLRDERTLLTISDQDEVHTKTLGIEWHSVLNHFRISVTNHVQHTSLTKQALVSDIAKTYDVLGWFSPTIVKAKICNVSGKQRSTGMKKYPNPSGQNGLSGVLS